MIERPAATRPRRDDTACQRRLSRGISGSGPVTSRVNAVPRPPRDLDDVEQVEFGELM
jgi:hypothetical protein